MGYKSLVKTVSGHFEYRKVGLGLLAGFLLSLTYLSPSIYFSLPLSNVNLNLSSTDGSPASSNGSMIILGGDNRNVTDENKPKYDANLRSKGGLCEDIGDFIKMNESSSVEASNDHSSFEESLVNSTSLRLENITLDEPTIDRPEVYENSKNSITNVVDVPLRMNFTTSTMVDILVSTNSSTSTTDLTQMKFADSSDRSENNITKILISDGIRDNSFGTDSPLKEFTSNSNQSVEEDLKPKNTKITCDTNPRRRSDRCEIDGDVRIHGKSGSVLFTASPSSSINETRTIQPYARKADPAAMASVRHLTVGPSNDPPRCGVRSTAVPAVVFSVTGYTGNFFHDFSDVLVPLFQTAFPFRGEVQFLVTNFRLWWMDKYAPILKQLSKYEAVDLDSDDAVRCFERAVVGLDSDGDLMIDPSRSMYSMVDFGRMLRTAYSLPKENAIRLAKRSRVKPKLVIVARSRTRRFTNVEKIVASAERIGYEVAVAEAEQHNVSSFARLANACDVMMGVHGAGLTNFVFMPTNAVLIQVVPWGGLDWIATNYFDKPPRAMNLRYLEYKISEDESTLSETYSRDDPVFADPAAIHRRGWPEMRKVYLVQQNVRLDVKRFRPVLVKALRLLRSKK